MTTVLHVESERFRGALGTVASLDAMIPLHNQQWVFQLPRYP